MLTVYRDYKKVNIAGGTAVAIGNFDGVHRGHQKMLSTLKTVANEYGVPSVVYTFLEHPVNVLKGDLFPGIIYENSEKERLIAGSNIHTLFFEDFNTVCHLTPEEFVENILIDKLNIRIAVIGENGRFGKNGAGDAKVLEKLGKQYGFDVNVVKALEIDGEACSSSRIRNEIMSGDVEKAEKMLGRAYSLSGEVVSDKHLGRTYGYPTANIIPRKNALKLKSGVYATNVIFDGRTLPSITNVGTTSFDDDDRRRIETHILDFSGDLYGKRITVEFLYYMRDFKNFLNTDQLKLQLDEDRKMRKLGGN